MCLPPYSFIIGFPDICIAYLKVLKVSGAVWKYHVIFGIAPEKLGVYCIVDTIKIHIILNAFCICIIMITSKCSYFICISAFTSAFVSPVPSSFLSSPNLQNGHSSGRNQCNTETWVCHIHSFIGVQFGKHLYSNSFPPPRMRHWWIKTLCVCQVHNNDNNPSNIVAMISNKLKVSRWSCVVELSIMRRNPVICIANRNT